MAIKNLDKLEVKLFLDSCSIIRKLPNSAIAEKVVGDPVLMVGIVGSRNSENFVEVFKTVKNNEDLKFLYNAGLRSRFNPDRNYKMFYFKCNESHCDSLIESSLSNNKSFAKWVCSSPSIKHEKI